MTSLHRQFAWISILRAFWFAVRLGFELVGVLAFVAVLLAIGWLLAGN
jgi:hypothetical protein